MEIFDIILQHLTPPATAVWVKLPSPLMRSNQAKLIRCNISVFAFENVRSELFREFFCSGMASKCSLEACGFNPHSG